MLLSSMERLCLCLLDLESRLGGSDRVAVHGSDANRGRRAGSGALGRVRVKKLPLRAGEPPFGTSE